MNNSRGFTLIELVVVIVLIGVLSAVAIPKFYSISADARLTILESLKGSLTSGAHLVYYKSVIDGVDSGSDYLDINGDGTDDISIRSGYPRVAGSCDNFLEGLDYWMTLSIDASCDLSNTDAEWYGVVEKNMFHFIPSGYSGTSDNCYVTYTTASELVNKKWVDTDSATVSAITTGCTH
jgi:MSHA pilin protein MshA